MNVFIVNCIPGGVEELISETFAMLSVLSLLLKLLHALLSLRGKSNGPEKAFPDNRMMAILI